MSISNFAKLIALLCWLVTHVGVQAQEQWQTSWPNTDFSTTKIDLSDIISGGPGKDGIPAIDHPQFVKSSSIAYLSDDEPVIGLSLGKQAKAYPLRILIWHEIVNDIIDDTPIAVTYCPLCNTSIVFKRRLNGQILDFGTTGNLRHSDLIMYDRQTESWWQQYGGDAIVGHYSGATLEVLPSRLESFKNFKQRFPDGLVLEANNPHARRYGSNPYVGYDRSPFPFLFKGTVPKGVLPMMRVVAINDTAIGLPLLRTKKRVESDGMVLTWSPGQNSSLDTRNIQEGRDIGNIVVTKKGRDEPYVVTFAFAFFAFNEHGKLLTLDGIISGQ